MTVIAAQTPTHRPRRVPRGLATLLAWLLHPAGRAGQTVVAAFVTYAEALNRAYAAPFTPQAHGYSTAGPSNIDGRDTRW